MALAQAYSGMSRHAEAVRELQQCINKAQKSHELAPRNVIQKASVLLHQEQVLVCVCVCVFVCVCVCLCVYNIYYMCLCIYVYTY